MTAKMAKNKKNQTEQNNVRFVFIVDSKHRKLPERVVSVLPNATHRHISKTRHTITLLF